MADHWWRCATHTRNEAGSWRMIIVVSLYRHYICLISHACCYIFYECKKHIYYFCSSTIGLKMQSEAGKFLFQVCIYAYFKLLFYLVCLIKFELYMYYVRHKITCSHNNFLSENHILLMNFFKSAKHTLGICFFYVTRNDLKCDPSSSVHAAVLSKYNIIYLFSSNLICFFIVQYVTHNSTRQICLLPSTLPHFS